MARMAHVDEMVGPAVFLLSDAASYVTGVDLAGGWRVLLLVKLRELRAGTHITVDWRVHAGMLAVCCRIVDIFAIRIASRSFPILGSLHRCVCATSGCKSQGA